MASTKQSSNVETKEDEKTGYVTKKKTNTVLQEERTVTQQQRESHKLITGTLEDLMPIIRTEAVKYEPTVSEHRGRSPQPTKSVPVVATETRKVAYTTDTVSLKHFRYIIV